MAKAEIIEKDKNMRIGILALMLCAFYVFASSATYAEPIFGMEFKTLQPKRTQKAETARKPFRGNTKTFKYHRPDCIHYDCKTCTKLFRTEREAKLAGYEPCAKCGE